MVNCYYCGAATRPSEKPTRVTMALRQVTFAPRADVNRHRRFHKRWVTSDPGGKGLQLVAERLVHESCAEMMGHL